MDGRDGLVIARESTHGRFSAIRRDLVGDRWRRVFASVPFDPPSCGAAAGEFFDTIAQFYRRAYLRYINATGRVRYNRGRQSLDRHAIHIGAARDVPLPRSVHELTDLGYTSLETRSRSVSETESRRDSAGRMARLVIAAVIVAAIVAVAIDNREKVDVGYVVGDASAPIWVVLVVAGIAGVVIGWLVKHRPSRH